MSVRLPAVSNEFASPLDATFSTALRILPPPDGCALNDVGTTLRRACTKVTRDRPQVVNAQLV
jgi:hypothetical protein